MRELKLPPSDIPIIKELLEIGECPDWIASLYDGISTETILALLPSNNCEKGEKHHFAKLKDADIPVIRERLAQGEAQKDIARDYGVISHTISDINTGKSWKHIP